MTDLLANKLTAEDFDPEKYVQGLSGGGGGGLELHQQRHRIHALAKETNAHLKKNVYNNYMQFIETAKEISYLESEMYQLSHLITEQKSLLVSMLELSIPGDRGPGTSGGGGGAEVKQEAEAGAAQEEKQRQEKEGRRNLMALCEKIEGCSHVLEAPQRVLVHEGELVELSQDDYSGQQRVRACLLSDSFMLASWLAHRRGPVRYKFETLHLLDALVPVNIKDRGQATNAFKLLIFPDSRVFQAPSLKAKTEWLQHIEKAKHAAAAAEQQSTDQQTVVASAVDDSKHVAIKQQDSLDSNMSAEDDGDSLSNPFCSWNTRLSTSQQPQLQQVPTWIQELPEDLDQAIAQRNLEDALTLIHRGLEYFAKSPKTAQNAEMKRGVESRVKILVGVMRRELKVAGDRSLNAGPKAARRAANILIQLNKQQMACDLFLRYRTALLKASLQNLRLEGQTVVYVRHLCAVFFRNLDETMAEFNKVFAECLGCLPALLVWAGDSITMFSAKFSQHVFSTQSSLTTVSECVSIADHHCNQVAGAGLDLRFTLHAALSRDLERRVASARDKMLDAIKVRGQSDGWEPLVFPDAASLQTLLDDLNDAGVAGVQDYQTGERCLGLTASTVQLVRLLVGFVEDVLRVLLVWQDAAQLLADALTAVLSAQLQHCRAALEHPMLRSKASTIRLNGLFLLDVLVPLTEQRYTEVTGHQHPTLPDLRRQRHIFVEPTSSPTTANTAYV